MTPPSPTLSPAKLRRIVVVGACGSGKSTLSQTLARRLGVPLVELDALQHGPGWTPRPTFVEDADTATRGPAWIVDGNYASVRELLWARADAVIWIDLPRPLVFWQVVRRSFVRWVRGTELWNGNRERGPRSWLDPEHPIRWSWKKHPFYREFYAERFAAAKWAHLDRVRIRTRQGIQALIDRLAEPTT